MRTGMSRVAAFGLCLGMMTGAATHQGLADDISFKDKRLMMLIGSAPGGGTDTTGRLVAPFFHKYLPLLAGRPT